MFNSVEEYRFRVGEGEVVRFRVYCVIFSGCVKGERFRSNCIGVLEYYIGSRWGRIVYGVLVAGV